LLATLFGRFPFLAKLFADSAYAGSIFHTALHKVMPNLKTEIVRRSDRAKGFVPLPKRWIVERTIAWLNRCRRLAKDWENLNRKALAFLRLASIRLMLSTTGSQITSLVRRHVTDAALASRQGRCNGDGQQTMDGGDRVRDVALRPDRGRRGVGNRWEWQIFRLQRRDQVLRGECSPARRSGSRRQRSTLCRGDGNLAMCAPHNGRGRFLV